MQLTRNITVIFFLTALIVLEPSIREKVFAVTLFENPAIDKSAPVTAPVIKDQQTELTTPPVRQKSRAPEPSTLFLLISGLGGMIVRFAQRSFDKFKRMTDVVLSVLGLTVLAPILAFAAMLIKMTSKGPIIYRQARVGRNGNIFRIYKLRSMRVDAEKGVGAVWAKKNDPRITPVGKFLRKSHIDEIPQLLNVLRGDMSIVGPRPERPEIVSDLKKIIHDYEKRLLVKPGITGLAQVWHKYDESIEDVKKKIKYDCLYIRKMCLLVDMRIIARTFVAVVTGRGAN